MDNTVFILATIVAKPSTYKIIEVLIDGTIAKFFCMTATVLDFLILRAKEEGAGIWVIHKTTIADILEVNSFEFEISHQRIPICYYHGFLCHNLEIYTFYKFWHIYFHKFMEFPNILSVTTTSSHLISLSYGSFVVKC